MKRIYLSVVLCTFMSSMLWAQKEYAVDNFHGISASGNIQVFLDTGEQEKVQLYAEGVPEDEITIRVSQGTLRLASLNSFLYKDAVVKIYVTYKKLDEIRVSAGAMVQGKTQIVADDFTASAGSGAQIELLLQVKDLEASASEGARVELRGTADTQDVSAMTGGQYKAQHLISQEAYIRSNTGARAEVHAEKRLEVSANTGGEIIYYGDPKTKYIKNILGGDVRQGHKSSE